MVTTLKSPALLGSRELAPEFFADLPDNLTGSKVVRLPGHRSERPTFVDEVVKCVLVERRADFLTFLDAPERTASYVVRSADRRGVADRLEVRPR